MNFSNLEQKKLITMKIRKRKAIIRVVALVIVTIIILLFLAGYIWGPDKMWVKPPL